MKSTKINNISHTIAAAITMSVATSLLSSVAVGHGNPIQLRQTAGSIIIANLASDGTPLFETGRVARVSPSGPLVTDRPGLTVARSTDGIAAGTGLGLHVNSSLYWFDGTAVDLAAEGTHLSIFVPSSAEIFYDVDRTSEPQTGLPWATYNGIFGWHADGLFVLSDDAAPGLYGVAAQVTGTGYAPSEEFLMTWLYDPFQELDASRAAGISLLREKLFPSPVPADLNGDGSVDALDAGILFANWSRSGTGDLNDDNLVDAADAGILFGGWTGDTSVRDVGTGNTSPAAVPEPLGVGLTSIVACAAVVRATIWQRRCAGVAKSKCPNSVTFCCAGPNGE